MTGERQSMLLRPEGTMMVIPNPRLSPSLAAPFPPNILTVQPRTRAIVAIISANVL